MPATLPSVDVILVNWNGAEVLEVALESLRHQDYQGELRAVVVDNGSTDDSVAMVESRFPEAVLILSDVNRGFAGGVQWGIDRTDGEIVVLLNNDAEADPGFVTELVETLLAGGPGLGAATARILLRDRRGPSGARLINSTGNQVLADGNGRDRNWLDEDGTVSPDAEVFGFCGGAAALRREALDRVGGFDPELFLYYEDTELSWRLRNSGFGIVYAPGAVAVHAHAWSTGTGSPVFQFQNVRNRLLVSTRHAPAGVALRGWINGAGKAAVTSVTGLRSAAGRQQAATMRRAVLAAVRLLPRELRTRRALRKVSVLSSAQRAALITHAR